MLVGSTSASLYIGSNRVKAARQGAALRYFRPDSIPGLQAWWDASDSGSVVLSGSNVATLSDKSGNGNDAVMPATLSSPAMTSEINGLQAMYFDGGDALTVPESKAAFKHLHDGTASTVFAVVSPGITSDPNALMSFLGNYGAASATVGVGLFFDDRLASGRSNSLLVSASRGVTGATAMDLLVQEAFTPQQPTVVSVSLDGDAPVADRLFAWLDGSLSSQINATANSPSSADSTYDMQLGCAGNFAAPFQGDIAEILIFDAALSAADRQLVEGYLAWKWGLQSKLPYNHPYAPQAIGGGSQTVPTDSDVLAFAAASGAKSIPDLNKIEDLVTYLKAQGLWNYARFYPMKSSQNAGTGSTVYGLGGLTSNNMTLVNSPTWGSDGVTFDAASSQCGRIADFLESATLNAMWRGTNTTVSASESTCLAQYNYADTRRSIAITKSPSAEIKIWRSSDGSGVNVESYAAGAFSAVSATVIAEWIDGGGRDCFVDGVSKTLSLSNGSPQASRLNVSDDITLMAWLNGSTPSNFSSGVASFAGFIETALTTTQRETITDLINAL